MKTLQYIAKKIQFLKSLNIKTKANTADSVDFEFTYTKSGINLKQGAGKAPNSLFHQMYAEENENLFI
jgi:hypothetical protein